jgi:hypothetical protein
MVSSPVETVTTLTAQGIYENLLILLRFRKIKIY